MDTTSWESQVAFFKSVLRWQDNHLDIVVTAAGVAIADFESLLTRDEEEPPEPSIHTIQVNLIGVFYSSFLALFYFRKLAKSRRAGFDPQLLIVSSLAGYVARDVGSDYAASKWGSRGFWKTIRYIASGHGHTQTNLVAPTYIDTPMISAFVPTLKDAGITVGAVDDFVRGSMRVLCDSAVDGAMPSFSKLGTRVLTSSLGRAICIAAGGNEPGSKNFDLEDDLEDGDGNLQIRKEAEARVFGTMFD